MKTLQNNFTTSKQSKRLLELDVPADSADCYLNGDFVIMLNDKTFQETYNEDLDLARLHLVEYPHYIPCWSVGRLIEIYCTCRECTWEYITNNPPIEDILCDIELHINDLDFSKLDEK